MNVNIAFEDIVFAYRKAKYEVFHDNNYTMLERFVDYEKGLYENLNKFHATLISRNRTFVHNKKFLGSHEWIIKKIDFGSKTELGQENDFVYRTNRLADWRHTKKDYQINYRYVGNLSVEFHILGSLWIDKVGHLLEAIVGECSYGCRLKRPRQKFNRFIPQFNFAEEIAPNKLENGHFRFYPPDYRRWQKDGLHAMQAALKKEKKVIALTTDIQSFYHRIHPGFLLHSDFVREMGIRDYDETQEYLTKLITEALLYWGDSVITGPKDKKINSTHGGVPVGWAPSKIIANLLLHKFDSAIKKGLTPLFYGRYVDDIFMVLEDNGELMSRTDVWRFIEQRVDGVRYSSESILNDVVAEYNHPYSAESIINFGHDKEKVFVLEGTSGETLIEKVEQSLNDNSSEWRFLPESEESMVKMADDIASSGSDFSEAVDNLRKSDGISIGRLKFILLIQKLEIMVDSLPKEIWHKSLQKLFSFTKDFILVPENLPIYCGYHSRLISLFSRAQMYKEVIAMSKRIDECFLLLREGDSSNGDLFNRSREFHHLVLKEAFLRGFVESNSANDRQMEQVLKMFELNLDDASKRSQLIFLADLHRIPFKEILFRKKLARLYLQNLNDEYNSVVLERLQLHQTKALFQFWKQQKRLNKNPGFFPTALFFCTRPMTLLDLTVLYPKWSANEEYFKRFKQVILGFNLKLNIAPPSDIQKDLVFLEISTWKRDKNPVVALTSFLVDQKSWKAIVRQEGIEPDQSRIPRMFELTNNILRCKSNIDYVIFPELSIPRRLLSMIAQRFNNAGISFITGTEYLFRATPGDQFRGYVKNQLLYYLTTNGRQVVRITQEKTIPATHEERELFQIGGWILKADDGAKYIINHKGFVFSGLICNDFLNIDNRQQLRGKVDTLIVVEWNKDTNTYDPLVQSSSNDLHCFVIQVNNREYGDTRLRGPYKESYKRDRVSVRGGILDYFVVSDIEINELRDFQRNFRSPDGPFKPVPTGFKMSEDRKKNN
jgi:hypothetical protein